MSESFFVVSKQNLDLAIDEIKALAETYDRFAKVQTFVNLVLVQSTTDRSKITKRATYVKNSGEVIQKIPDLFSNNKIKLIPQKPTFACKVLNLTKERFDPFKIEKTMGDLVSKNSNGKVCLKNPDLVIYQIFAEGRKFFGFSLRTKKEKRPKKIKTHPNQLDWKLTRSMINLCRLKDGQTVCDPFCGTGTTLLEAEHMRLSGIGIDSNKKMCEIANKNSVENKFSARVINSDFSHITKIIDKIDGVVTDIPYGKNSKINQSPENLIKELLEKIPEKKRFAIMYKKEFGKEINLKNVKKYRIYRHKSLTRTILVR